MVRGLGDNVLYRWTGTQWLPLVSGTGGPAMKNFVKAGTKYYAISHATSGNNLYFSPGPT